MGEMSEVHKYMLQAFMSHQVLVSTELKEMYETACTRYSVAFNWADIGQVVNVINRHIEHFHMNIKKGTSEDKGASSYVLVNITDNKFLQCSSDYTVNELEFFKKVVELVVESGEGTVPKVDVMNLTDCASFQKKMSKSAVQDLFDRLINDKWLINLDGSVALSTRAILELDQYIKDQYPDSVMFCNVCNYLCLLGHICPSCSVKLHIYCSAKYFKNQETPKCPNCSNPWQHDVPQVRIGTQGQPSQSQAKGKQSQRSQRKRRSNNTGDL